MNFNERLKIGKFEVMQQRARGMSTKRPQYLQEENQRMANQIQSQLELLVSLRKEIQTVSEQRNSYMTMLQEVTQAAQKGSLS